MLTVRQAQGEDVPDMNQTAKNKPLTLSVSKGVSADGASLYAGERFFLGTTPCNVKMGNKIPLRMAKSDDSDVLSEFVM